MFDRRTFLRGTAAAAVAATVPTRAAAAASAATQHRGPLAPAAFLRLPPGAIRPQGWLATQLTRQLGGLCGRFAETSHFLQFDRTGWVHPELDGWEEVPYWLRGCVPLAAVTGDPAARSTAQRWMDAVLATGNGTRLRIHDCNGAAAQKFRLS